MRPCSRRRYPGVAHVPPPVELGDLLEPGRGEILPLKVIDVIEMPPHSPLAETRRPSSPTCSRERPARSRLVSGVEADWRLTESLRRCSSGNSGNAKTRRLQRVFEVVRSGSSPTVEHARASRPRPGRSFDGALGAHEQMLGLLALGHASGDGRRPAPKAKANEDGGGAAMEDVDAGLEAAQRRIGRQR